jgi:hypothetical protein
MSPTRKPADITRREFLKMSALAGGASLLAACGGETVVQGSLKQIWRSSKAANAIPMDKLIELAQDRRAI